MQGVEGVHKPDGFCPYCGVKLGLEGCPNHPQPAVTRAGMVPGAPRLAARRTALPVAVASEAHEAPSVDGPRPYRMGRISRLRPRTFPWRVVGAGALLVALAGAFIVQAKQSEAQARRIDALTQRLGGIVNTQAATAQQLSAVTGELAATNKRLTALEGKQGSTLDTAAVSAKVVNSVFTVRTSKAIGSAFAFRSTGSATWLVTNFHVVADDFNAGVRAVDVVRGMETYSGTITAVDEARDLAAIRVPFAVPSIARSAHPVAVGQPVLVVGAPLNLGQTVTTGVVSALRDGQIQFSAPVSPGNSGGPVVDANGEVVGVTEAKIEAAGAEGLAFAIPIANVCQGILPC
jgi:S1-C subfamily serine protease